MIKDTTVNIGEARANLSDLVKRAAGGEKIIISKAGVPQAKLVPVAPLKERPGGILAHLFSEEELEEVARYVEEDTGKAYDWSEFYEDINFEPQ